MAKSNKKATDKAAGKSAGKAAGSAKAAKGGAKAKSAAKASASTKAKGKSKPKAESAASEDTVAPASTARAGATDVAMAQVPASFRAIHRYARITARKARLVADLIRGRSVNDALEVLEFQHKRAASFYSQVVRSAMANALAIEGVNANRLVITECHADDGPMLQKRMRFRPGPQGRAMPFKKLTSHLTVVVAEREGARIGSGKQKRKGTKVRSGNQSGSQTGNQAVAAKAQG